MRDTRYICTLSEVTQVIIREALEQSGLSKADIRHAMDSRVCDLEDAILDLVEE